VRGLGGEDVREGLAGEDCGGHVLEEVERGWSIGVGSGGGGGGGGQHVQVVDADESGGEFVGNKVEEGRHVDAFVGEELIERVDNDEALFGFAHGECELRQDLLRSEVSVGGDGVDGRVEPRGFKGDDYDVDVTGESAADNLVRQLRGALVEVVEHEREWRRIGADVEKPGHDMDRVTLVLRQSHWPVHVLRGRPRLGLAPADAAANEVLLFDPAAAVDGADLANVLGVCEVDYELDLLFTQGEQPGRDSAVVGEEVTENLWN